MGKIIIILIVFLILSPLYAHIRDTSMENPADPEVILQKLIDDHKTPSIQYKIFNTDRIIYSYRNGLADIGKNRFADEQTTYHAYSVTKTFTALAVLQLAADGKVNIDDPVLLYLPDFPYGQHISIRNLLTHSSGIPNPVPLSWIHLEEDHHAFDKGSFVENVIRKNSKTRFSPDVKFAYSNIGYMILGKLIEKVSGQSYESYVREHILMKLKPNELDFTINNPAIHARGYHKRWSFGNALLGFLIDKSRFMDQPESKWKPFKPFYVNDPAYGGLIGTPAGFVAYLREMLKDESILLPDNYKNQLFIENSLADGSKSGMCLAWFTGNLNGIRYFTHAGGGGGYYIELRIYPDLGLGSVIIFNRSGIKDERFLDKIDSYFLESPMDPYKKKPISD